MFEEDSSDSRNHSLMKTLRNYCIGVALMVGCSVTQAAMTVHLAFDNAGNIYDDTGSVDVSGNWTKSGNVTQVTGTGYLSGNAASFTASSSNAVLSGLTGVADFSSITFSFHMKTSDIKDWASPAAFGGGQWSGRYQFAQRLNGGSPDGFSVEPASSPGGVSGTWVEERGWNMTDNAWHHYALTIGSGTIKLYLDGALVDSGSYSGTGNITSFSFGSRLGGGSENPITAYLADVAIYNTALSSSQIAWLSDNVAIQNPIPEASALVLGLMSIPLLMRRRRRV